jgi:hypothetical protein
MKKKTSDIEGATSRYVQTSLTYGLLLGLAVQIKFTHLHLTPQKAKTFKAICNVHYGVSVLSPNTTILSI